MADGTFPTKVSATNDDNAVTNPLFSKLTDGTNAATFTGTSLDVNITGGATSGQQYAEDSAAVSGDMGNVALVVRKDTPGTNVDADGDYATLLQDANGRLYTQIHDGGNSITVDNNGTFAVQAAQSGAWSVAVNNGAGAAAVNIQDGGNSITVDAVDLDIRDLTLAQDAVKVSGNSSANSQSNPIYVQHIDNNISGEVNSYNTAASVSAGGTSNHDYTVVTAMRLKSVEFACSGAMKVEVQVGPIASLVSKGVSFIPNAGGGNRIVFDPPIEVATTGTGTVRVIRTNRNNQSTDVYSTILGIDA